MAGGLWGQGQASHAILSAAWDRSGGRPHQRLHDCATETPQGHCSVASNHRRYPQRRGCSGVARICHWRPLVRPTAVAFATDTPLAAVLASRVPPPAPSATRQEALCRTRSPGGARKTVT